jgi:hypothetical protein
MKKERAKRVSKLLAIALAILGIGAFVFHEVLGDSLARRSEKLRAAEATFGHSGDISTIQMNSALLRAKLTQLQAQQASADQDYSAMTREQQQEARLASANLRANFGNLSKFIDSLPQIPKFLTENRELVRTQVESVDASTQKWLTQAPKDKSDPAPLLLAIGVQMECYVAEIGILVLGDGATKVADQENTGIETLQTICRWLSWACGISVAILLLYRALYLSDSATS